MFGEFDVLIHCDMFGEAVVYVSLGSEPVRSVAKYSLRLRRLISNGGEDRRPNIEDTVHEVDRAVVYLVAWVGFPGLVYYFRGVYAPLFVYLCFAIILRSWKMRSWDVSGKRMIISLGRASGPGAFSVDALLAGHGVVVACEVMV